MKKAKILLALILSAGINTAVSAQTFGWARLSANLKSYAVAADASGNSYILNPNKLEKRNSGGTLTWSKEVHINSGGVVLDATCDYLGNIYLTGYYYSDVTQATANQNGGPGSAIYLTGCTQVVLPGNIVPDGNLIGHKLFFVKADPNGNMLWAKTFTNATDYSFGSGLTTDPAGNVYLLGRGSNQSDFGGGTIISSTAGQFVAKFNSSGTYIYAKNIQNNYNVNPAFPVVTNNDLSVNNNQELVVSGEFSGTVIFNPGASQFSATSLGSTDAFVIRYNSSGVFQRVIRMGGTGTDVSCGTLIDNAGNSYLYGLFSGTMDINTSQGVSNRTASGANDMFIFSNTAAGSFRWGNTFGGTGAESAFATTLTDFDLHLTGGFSGTVDFNPGAGVNNLTSAGGTDIFTVGFDLLGGVYTYGYRNGSTGNDIATDICGIPTAGNTTLFMTGTFENTVNFHTTGGTANLTATGTSKVYEVKTTAPATSGRLANPANQTEINLVNSVYPNPFAGNIHLSLANEEQVYTVIVYSIDGRMVYSTTINGAKETDLNLTELNAGIYLMNIESEGKTEQHKIIKE